MTLPMKIEDLTPEWLSEALGEWTPGVRVAAIEDMQVIWGTATKIRVRLRYASTGDGHPPADLCIKGGFSEDMRPLVSAAYCQEANFFRHLARRLQVPLPRCWFARAEPEHGQGIIILDDLVVQGARFGDPLEPWPVDRVAAGLELQARWHAATWNATPEQYPWLHVGSWVRVPTAFLLSAPHWARMLADPQRAALMPTALHDRDRTHRATYRMWQLDDEQGVPCLNHCDAHVGNTYIDSQDQPRFLDWQSASLAPGVDDVGYFIVGALTVAERRSSERTLLAHYLDALAARGGPLLSFDAFWLDYRRHHMHGFLWAVTPPEMQSQARGLAMIERYCTALVDHDTLGALGV